jgi:acylphosphatase
MPERRQITIHGFVQGVYFRETVRQIAQRHAVAGFVRNVGRDRVEIEAEGEPAELDAFVENVLANPPPSARVDRVESSVAPATGERSFIVAPTVRG